MLQVGKSAGDDSVTLVEAAKVLKRVLPLVYPQIIRNTDVKFPRDDRFLEALLKYEVGSPFSPWQEGGGADQRSRRQIIRGLEFVAHQLQ